MNNKLSVVDSALKSPKLCFVFVIESATRDVKSESIQPKIAKENAAGRIAFNSLKPIIPILIEGNALGISPIVATSNFIITLKTVQTTNAIKLEGTFSLIFFGVKNTIANVNTLKINA